MINQASDAPNDRFSHSGLPHMPCPKCGRMFATKSGLKGHLEGYHRVSGAEEKVKAA